MGNAAHCPTLRRVSYSGATPTKFGRYAVAEPMRFARFHRPQPASSLKTVSWTIPVPVQDQEDLFAQDIDTSALIKGAARVDALGSCTAQATTVCYAERSVATNGSLPKFLSATDAVANEKWSIVFYHQTTDLTGDPSQEYPPTDCGSTGLYCCQELERLGLIKSYTSGSDVEQLLSMLQTGTVIQGTPFFNSWMSPDQDGFIDGDGSRRAIEEAIDSGVAGGHETCIYAIESLGSLQKTVLGIRNSWGDGWGLKGNFRMHASTLDYLCRYAGSQVDFKSFVL